MAQNYQYSSPVDQPGSTGRGGVALVGVRDIMDARRMMNREARTPSAEYPDGYLGTITSDRRQDKLLKNVQSRLTQRSYQRGVHKGERLDPRDYYWNEDVSPMVGLEYEAKGLKWTQRGTPAERLAHLGKVEMLSPAELGALQQKTGISVTDAPRVMDPARAEKMRRMLPGWK